MTIDELGQTLREAGVRPDAYCLDGGLPSEVYCLGATSGGWAVYYSERGVMTGRKVFADLSDACTELLEWILDDPTTRT